MKEYIEIAQQYLNKLCIEIKDRSVGSPGNLIATKFYYEKIKQSGFDTVSSEFDCIDWNDAGCLLIAEGENFEAYSSPYSNGCNLKAELCAASSIEELKKLDARNKILLLYGDITKEQLMPESFPFYNPDEHKIIRDLLKNNNAKAIITATSRNPELAGGMYPFPMIEDGDFNIPSAFMKDVEGKKLLSYLGKELLLQINAGRIPAKGFNVVASKGKSGKRRILVSAHIDAKKRTSGAIDNATGVIVLLLLADLLKQYTGEKLIEFAAFNGEDYYAIPGQMLYLEQNNNKMDNYELVINIDGAGYFNEKSAFSMYNIPDEKQDKFRKIFLSDPEIIEGVQWIQSDHGMFVQMGIPAIALTSDNFMAKLSAEITHTKNDKPEIVDCSKLVKIAFALNKLINSI
jgi:aminopeptidase YwaD